MIWQKPLHSGENKSIFVQYFFLFQILGLRIKLLI